jgi:hypothetical protein
MTTRLELLQAKWDQQWPDALAIWSRFTRLRAPLWCLDADAANVAGLTGSFAMIRLSDQGLVINLELVEQLGLGDFGREIMAHEIGHHIYCPANLNDDARMIARMRWALPTKEILAGFVANLYSDLLINDHLQRSAELNMAGVYRQLVSDSSNRMWTLYMRIYEILWSIEKGKLGSGKIDDRLEGDAHLGARLIRSYARDWLDGSGRFAALCLPYLLEDSGQEIQKLLETLRDTRNSGLGGMPSGLTGMDAGEKEGALHPSLDPELAGFDQPDPPRETSTQGGSTGQYRQPFEYGEILRSLGLDLSSQECAARYYRERASGSLVRFPVKNLPKTTDPLPEGLEPWDIAGSLDQLDWFESLMLSPRLVPGLTTVQRVWGTSAGANPKQEALDLDLYIDSSGSMPNPQVNISYLTLAGTIIALSALKAGARVQATLWSGARQFQSTAGFVRNEREILQILTGFLGGGTAFPIHKLRDTYQLRQPDDRPVHIMVISDNGVTTMYNKDEKGHNGYTIAGMALEKARGGGTLVLNLFGAWEDDPGLVRAHEQGWQINSIRNWEELVDFARRFSRITYAEKGSKT